MKGPSGKKNTFKIPCLELSILCLLLIETAVCLNVIFVPSDFFWTFFTGSLSSLSPSSAPETKFKLTK